MRYPVHFKFYNQHGYTMFKGLYSRMIIYLQFYGEYQDLQHIHDFLMEPQFGLMENIMTQIMGKISQNIKLSKGDLEIPTFTETIIFMEFMTQDIK